MILGIWGFGGLGVFFLEEEQEVGVFYVKGIIVLLRGRWYVWYIFLVVFDKIEEGSCGFGFGELVLNYVDFDLWVMGSQQGVFFWLCYLEELFCFQGEVGIKGFRLEK